MFNPLVIISSIVYHYLIYSNNVLLKYFFKPFTTILIIGASIEAASSKTNKTNNKLYGLLFSLLGDIFLMFEGELMFICGLSSFLCAHIFYIFVFYNARTTKQSKTLLMFLIFLASSYYSYIYKEVFNQGGYVMMVAVLIYVIAITAMVYFAYLNNNSILALGVTMFFISDAAIAFDKFVINATENKLEYLVMSTYHVAQLCIAQY